MQLSEVTALKLFMEMFLAKGNENIIVYAYYDLKVSKCFLFKHQFVA